MGTVLEAALEVQRFLVQAGERFCFIGALALQRWGEPRATRDVDLTLLCPFGGGALRICSAEDLVVLKAFAARPRDWLDVESILVRHGAKLDWPLVVSELEPLVAVREAPEIVERLNELRRKLV